MFRSIMRGDLGLLGASACIRQVMIRRSRRCPSIRSGIRQVMTRRIRRCSGPRIRTWQGNNLKNSLLRVNIFQQIIWQQRLIRCRPDVLRATA